MTIPGQRRAPGTFSPVNLIKAAFDHMQKALDYREQYAQEVAEARDSYGRPGTLYPTAPRPIDAEIQYQGTPGAKVLISNNRWHMVQSMMFGVADLTKTVRMMVIEQKRTNALLEELVKRVGDR